MNQYSDTIKKIKAAISHLCTSIEFIPPKTDMGVLYAIIELKRGAVMELYKYFSDKQGFKKWKFQTPQFKTLIYGTHVIFKIEDNKKKGTKYE